MTDDLTRSPYPSSAAQHSATLAGADNRNSLPSTPWRFQKKPVQISAVLYDPPNNCEVVWRFLGWDWPGPQPEGDFYPTTWHDDECDSTRPVYIETLEGLMEASPGDWIIRGISGEFYPCKPDIFERSYDALGPAS